jgi:hypothetical protein
MAHYRYKEAKRLVESIIGDLDILSGDVVGPSDVTWQDVAGTLMVNLSVLAGRISEARQGNVADPPVVFPSIREAYEEVCG